MEKEGLIIKKDFFIKSRKEDIREFYEFSSKVRLCLVRFWDAEPTELCTRVG